jgi:hypothetical protein
MGQGFSSIRFAEVVRQLAGEARALGLEVPGFRSPPRLQGVDRSLRRRAGATPAVAVRLRGRAVEAVLADMVEGIVVTNGCTGREAERVRDRLLAALTNRAAA